MSHHETYPSKEAFFIECNDPKKTLKFRVIVVCDKSDIINMLITPYIPPKGYSCKLNLFDFHCIVFVKVHRYVLFFSAVALTRFGITQIKEREDSPLDSSSECKLCSIDILI